jgi:AraC-like DNA-binding protein
MSSTAYAQDSWKILSNVNEVIKFIFEPVATPSLTDLSRLGHDVRLDGVTFWRIREAGSFRKCLNPGAVVYFLAVVSGELTLQVQFPEEETFRLKAGDAVSISGMTQHLFKVGRSRVGDQAIGTFDFLDFGVGRDPESGLDLMIGVAPHEAMSLANMINGPLVLLQTRDAEYMRHIWKAFEFLEDEYSEQEMHFDRNRIVRRIAEIMSININRAISHRGSLRMRTFTARRSDAYDRRMQGIWKSLRSFLEQPFQDWNLDRLARIAGMSRTAYCDNFPLATGMTPKKCISRIRLALVSNRLAIDRLPLSQAGELAGYQSAAAFVRAFQREFNETPAKWRVSRQFE